MENVTDARNEDQASHAGGTRGVQERVKLAVKMQRLPS